LDSVKVDDYVVDELDDHVDVDTGSELRSSTSTRTSLMTMSMSTRVVSRCMPPLQLVNVPAPVCTVYKRGGPNQANP
jgi:hypothetical protein